MSAGGSSGEAPKSDADDVDALARGELEGLLVLFARHGAGHRLDQDVGAFQVVGGRLPAGEVADRHGVGALGERGVDRPRLLGRTADQERAKVPVAGAHLLDDAPYRRSG